MFLFFIPEINVSHMTKLTNTKNIKVIIVVIIVVYASVGVNDSGVVSFI